MINLQFFVSNQWLTAFLINLILIGFGQRFPLLTKWGWFHAGVLGTILWGCTGIQGWLAVCIYLVLGSTVTKIGFAHKELRGIAEARGGRRGPENVWGAAATGCCLVMLAKFFTDSASILMIGFAASFAAKLADTFGSEIGKRYGSKAFLITTFKQVKPGVDGAISVEGTLASLGGSGLMTIVMVNLNLIPQGITPLIVASSGFIATILESYIGAIAQNRLLWLSNELVNFFQTTLAAIIAMVIYFLVL